MNLSTGEKNYMDSNSTQMSDVFTKWTKFGTGDWHYLSDSKQVVDYANSSRYTGYYDPNGNYDDIELEFSVMTTSADDDMIGAMIRFNQNEDGTHSSYLFLMDSHDYNGGISNGSYNGLNRILNINLANRGDNTNSGIIPLSVNSSWRWTRNAWQKYKIVAKSNTISAYLNDTLLTSITDSAISSGSYGFLTYSQDHTYFKDIVIKTVKNCTLAELLNKIQWDSDEDNIVINFNNDEESSLTDNTLQDYFINNKIHYIGVSDISFKTNIENFINTINNKGEFIDSTDYDTFINEISEYLINNISIKSK